MSELSCLSPVERQAVTASGRSVRLTCTSGSGSCGDTALTLNGLPALLKYDSISIVATTASSILLGRFCFMLKATWAF